MRARHRRGMQPSRVQSRSWRPGLPDRFFAPANGDAQSTIAKIEVFNVQGNQLGPAERASKTKQKEGAVTKSFEVCANLCE